MEPGKLERTLLRPATDALPVLPPMPGLFFMPPPPPLHQFWHAAPGDLLANRPPICIPQSGPVRAPQLPPSSPEESLPDAHSPPRDQLLGSPDQSEESNDLHRRLLELTDKTSYSIVQRNGQRIYGGPPPGWTGPPPGKGSEIFVGKVPRNAAEDELVPIFNKIGRIYELRLMMDFSGSNRGYLFVRYCDPADAARAVAELNNYEIRPNKRLGVLPSVDNRKLWISGIPRDRDAEEIKSEMSALTKGVINVTLCPSPKDKSSTRGYAFVEYETHRAAALARRILVPKTNYLFGEVIKKVDWAEPEREVNGDATKTVGRQIPASDHSSKSGE